MDSHWVRLLHLLNPDSPPENMRLYVSPVDGVARRLAKRILRDEKHNQKVLLVGARGGGKSTELRAIQKELNENVTVVGIDLDRSGITATSVSAFDLLYLSAVAMLRYLPEQERPPLFESLKNAYAGDKTQGEGLGDVQSALAGLSEFANMSSALAVAAGGIGGGVLGTGFDFITSTIRLLHRSDKTYISETSPMGSMLITAARGIAEKLQKHLGKRICVLIDGLEKMNGQSAERFRMVFEETRLLYNAPWSFVFAAPPCTLSETTAAEHIGYTTSPIYGFGPDGLKRLERVLELRLIEVGLSIQDLPAEALSKITLMSGGMPRDAIRILREAVQQMLDEDEEILTITHIEAGVRRRAQELARGLTTIDFNLLSHVYRKGELPGEEGAAKLFADGRILVYPPEAPQITNRWVVHPLLLPDIERRGSK